MGDRHSSILYRYVVRQTHIAKIVIIAFFGSIISQIGDISASKIKRKANVKDFGNIFIGHGGVMDRFDSFIFVLPYLSVLYCLGI